MLFRSFALQGMITLILATDMARHAEIMDSFKEKMENFDYSNEEHMTLVSRLVSPLGGGEPVKESSLQLRLQTEKPQLRLASEGGANKAGFQSSQSHREGRLLGTSAGEAPSWLRGSGFSRSLSIWCEDSK